ncbi:MAG TPA: hypothetical protein VLT88_14320, partial [Desulfosarcina sp.]|nr:hypothetical protein [Desulfosarcina sp.]
MDRSSDIEAALVRILNDSRTPVGAGCLAGDRHIVTCAHVVAAALGADAEAESPPQGTVRLDFPLLPGHPECEATVVKWLPVSEPPKMGAPEDIAVLMVVENSAIPDGAIPAQISSGPGVGGAV